jgi:hypothetical protein
MEAASLLTPRGDGNSLEGALGSRPRQGLAREAASNPRARRSPARGSSDPRVRRNLSRGGDQPTSEADLYRGGAVPLERSGVPPEGGWADCLTGRGSVGLFCACVLGSFAFIFYELKRVSPGCLGDPHGCPRQ